MSGTWNGNTSSAIRPGLYSRFVARASLNVVAAEKRGVVAIPLVNYAGGTAVSSKFYEVANDANAITNAEALFGAGNVQSIKFALEANVEKVLVYTVPAIGIAPAPTTEAEQYDEVRLAFDSRPVFDAFVYDGLVSAAEQDKAVLWVQKSKEEGRYFFVVLGCANVTEDQDNADGIARSTRTAHDDVINLTSSVEHGGVAYSSAAYAPFVAGLAVSTALNKSVTFKKVSAEDLGVRLTYTQTQDAIQAGSLVLTHTGNFVRVEQGVTTNKTKIRKSRVRQAISKDIKKLIEENVIGQIDNDQDGYTFVTTLVKAYLETLDNDKVIRDAVVEIDEAQSSAGDQLFLRIDYTEVDSVERVFLTIAV